MNIAWFKRGVMVGAALLIAVIALVAFDAPSVLAAEPGPDDELCVFDGDSTSGEISEEEFLDFFEFLVSLLGDDYVTSGNTISWIFTEDGHEITYSLTIVGEEEGFVIVQLSIHVAGCEEDEPAPAIWLAGVCEPYDGGAFNAYGQMTLDGTPGALLFAASPEGPWFEVGASGPPWVLTRDQLLNLAAELGVADFRELWFKVNENGKAARLGSMIADRNALMGDDCPPLDAPPPGE